MKNFLPGPTEVKPDVLEQLSKPLIGHHTEDFHKLLNQLTPKLQRLMTTRNPVFTLTCPASAAMEAALSNAAGKRILVLSNGAFGERWLKAARALGLAADGLILAWGFPLPEYEIGRVIDRTNCDTMVMVHGESSTGMLNPLDSAVSALKPRPDILFIVDAVATLGGIPLKMDEAGIDVLVGASQKCLALPPGVVPVGVSARALERSRKSKMKGYAFDFSSWQKRWQKGETLATPAIPQLQALNYQLDRIEEEGLEKRWERHQKLANMTLAWASNSGFVPFVPAGFRLPTISCLRPDPARETAPIVEALKAEGYLIDNGYGKLKNRTIRIGHMGDWQEDDLAGLLETLTQVLKSH
jgi:aspartate aminotransferase-like enzyme